MSDKKIEIETSAAIPQTTGPDSPLAGSTDTEGKWFEWEKMAAGHKTVHIRYKGMTYELRETRNGKLILTK